MRPLLLCLAAGLLVFACAQPPQESPAAGADTSQDEPNDTVSSDPKVQYFHEQLIANGEDIQSDFGGFLLTLKMHARDLQQDDPKHAYDTVLEEVRKVDDVELRREMARTFFNTPDVP